MKAPCKDCTERADGCHSHCEQYQAYCKEQKKIRENKQKSIFYYSPNKEARVRRNELNKMKGRAK